MYIIVKRKGRVKVEEYGEINGFVTKSKKGKITIVDNKLKELYACKQVEKKFKSCFKKIYNLLLEEDDSEDGVKACLGEIEKLKSSIFNKYKECLTRKQYKDFLAKIAITESEFKRKYKEREYYSKMMRDFYKTIGYNEEELISGRSR